MRFGRRGPWVCAPTGHVPPPPLTSGVGPHCPHAPGSAQHLHPLISCGNLRPPPHLGPWIDPLGNPFQHVTDRGSIACPVPYLRLSDMNVDANGSSTPYARDRALVLPLLRWKSQ